MKIRKLDKSYHIYGRFVQMKNLKAVLVAVLLIVVQLAHAEGAVSSDFISSIGKIYVVAGVCLVILITLFFYMYQLDRKISRIEKRYKND